MGRLNRGLTQEEYMAAILEKLMSIEERLANVEATSSYVQGVFLPKPKKKVVDKIEDKNYEAFLLDVDKHLAKMEQRRRLAQARK